MQIDTNHDTQFHDLLIWPGTLSKSMIKFLAKWKNAILEQIKLPFAIFGCCSPLVYFSLAATNPTK